MPPQVIPSEESADNVSCDALVIGAFSGDDGPSLAPSAASVDRALDGYLSGYLRDSGFKGKVGDVAVVPTLQRLPATTIAVAGLGRQDEANAHTVRRASGVAARKLGERSVLASALHDTPGDDGVEASTEGFLLGSYNFTEYKSDPRPSKISRILLVGSASVDTIERGQARAQATALARDLTNEPPSILTPESLARRAREMADVAGLECTIFDEQALADKGFGGLLGVSRGSERPPRFIHLHHKPTSARGKVVLVGKGVTFDSGGLSLKDAKNMETMKTDMGGAAAVIGAMSALSRLNVDVEVLGLIAATENMPGGNAIKPGDVIRHYGGRTSEVLNTDAEGRLILADALAFACEQSPDAVVDAATLTGACMVALGRKAAGLFSNDEALRAELEEAATRAGERVWPLPLYDDYRSDLDSEVADIKNVGSRYGGAITAALFLRDFVRKGVPWAHLDIAGPARAESDYDEVTKGGSGVATRTLIAFLEGRAR